MWGITLAISVERFGLTCSIAGEKEQRARTANIFGYFFSITRIGVPERTAQQFEDARYWEMYLTTSLILAGYAVTCPKPGPDVGIIYKGQRIWFEATCPTRGADGSPDQIPEMKVAALGEEPVVYDVPNDKIILRYLNSISGKYKDQYANWLKKGIVSEKDAFVIAVNPREIPFEYADTSPPRILRAGYTVGAPVPCRQSRDDEGGRVRLSLSRPCRESTKERCKRG